MMQRHPSRNGNGSAVEHAPPRRNGTAGAVGVRYRMASLLRLSGGIVGKAVSAYDRLFRIPRREQAEIYAEIGKDLAREGKATDAQLALRRTLEIKPDDAEAWFELGKVHMRLQAPAAAIECLQKAKTLGLESFELHCLLSEALADVGRLEESLTEIEEAVELEPEDADVFFRLGSILDELGRLEDAARAFRTAIDLSPKEPVYHQSLGFTLENMNRRREAVACFKRALKLERGVGLSR